MDKKFVMLGMIVGSIIGGYIPTLFGADVFSIYSLVFSAIGALLGIWASFRLLN
jgi:uncharacterized membrane protein YeaQ/YmgE (transglycosylase-associated protein family)